MRSSKSLLISVFFGIACASVSAQVTSSAYWTYAQQTHNFVVGNLLTPSNSYEIFPGSSVAYAWYVASQIDADAAMVKGGDSRYAAYMDRSASWMSHLWNTASASGGYFAQSNTDGTGAQGDQFVDDNSLIGLAYLDAYDVSSGTQKAAYLQMAEQAANWLMQSGQWDSTYGGGFWWSTQKQLKPTQSNGLAVQLFLRLYQLTGQTYYQQWATSIKSWLEGQMLGTNGLYIWEITNNGKQQVNFTYDNAIMIEADLLWAQVMNDPSYTGKAEDLATSLVQVLWNGQSSVFSFNTQDARVNTTWCVWASQSFIRLYQADGNAVWLNYAQANIAFVNTYLRDAATGSYHDFANLDGSAVDSTVNGVDQAWMQRVQALLAPYR